MKEVNGVTYGEFKKEIKKLKLGCVYGYPIDERGDY